MILLWNILPIAVKSVEDVVQLILLSLTVMSVSVLLQECYQSGMIFRRYYVWLNYLHIKNYKLKPWQKQQRKNQQQKQNLCLRNQVKNAKRNFIRNITHPMGLCPVCSNIWTSGIILSFLTNDLLSLILGIGMSNLFLIYHELITNRE